MWKFFYKKILYDCFYKNFREFKTAVIEFFKNIKDHKPKLKTLLAENFQIINLVNMAEYLQYDKFLHGYKIN